jgi:hypothetical protein
MPREAQTASLADRARVLAAARRSPTSTYFIHGTEDVEGLLEHATVCVFMEDDNGAVTDLAVMTGSPGTESLPVVVRAVNAALEDPHLTVRAFLRESASHARVSVSFFAAACRIATASASPCFHQQQGKHRHS